MQKLFWIMGLFSLFIAGWTMEEVIHYLVHYLVNRREAP